MDVRLFGIRFHSRAELLDGGSVVLHLIFCLAGQHVSLGRLGIQREDLAIYIEDARELSRRQAAVCEQKTKLQVLRIVTRGGPEVWDGLRVIPQAVLSNSQQC